ncbi:MAG: hypothetical protein ABFS16_10830 [Bacteroidota bacterium]
MKKIVLISIFVWSCLFEVSAQNQSNPDFQWGNASYFNINTGESIYFNNIEIKLLSLENHYNRIKVGTDTIFIKVSKRNLPASTNGVKIFVADNKNVKALTTDSDVHGLLKKDALICLSGYIENLLNPDIFIFPVSFNDGFMWSTEEDCYMFSYLGSEEKNGKKYSRSYEGIGIDLHDARGIEKHWLVAMENSTVTWIEEKNPDQAEKEVCVLLQSNSNPGIYYLYEHLYRKNILIKKGQKLVRGELLGTIWGDDVWGHFQLTVVKSDTIPSYKNRHRNAVNFFPQFYELYFKNTYSSTKSFTRGRIDFGRLCTLNGNEKNAHAFEEYSGRGWLLGKWNKSDKVEWITKGEDGNVRLRKVPFPGTAAKCRNPKNYYEYELNVTNGVYRIRAKMGDMFLPSWQKVEFEGVIAVTYTLQPGELKWTPEKVVKVTDRKLTVRIYIDYSNNKVAGLSQIVFQKAY